MFYCSFTRFSEEYQESLKQKKQNPGNKQKGSVNMVNNKKGASSHDNNQNQAHRQQVCDNATKTSDNAIGSIVVCSNASTSKINDIQMIPPGGSTDNSEQRLLSHQPSLGDYYDGRGRDQIWRGNFQRISNEYALDKYGQRQQQLRNELEALENLTYQKSSQQLQEIAGDEFMMDRRNCSNTIR